MRIEDILEHYVTVAQFAALFNSDQCTMRILEQVNKEVHQLEDDKEAQTKNARIKAERIEMDKKKSRIKKGLNSKVLNTENYKQRSFSKMDNIPADERKLSASKLAYSSGFDAVA
jgi:hypothetical protein